ncbi:WD40-repeat-containing domain protein [Obelidium mucronatum]|nr:WD40-repeat-containing domain protein [Obelidium mucronatum]
MSLIATLSGHTDRVWQATWHPAQAVLVSCSGDRSVRLWTQKDGRWTPAETVGDAHKRTVRAAAFAADGLLATAGFDGVVGVFEDSANAGFECVATLDGHENEVKSVAWAPAAPLLATCSRDKSVWVWEALGDADFECVAVLAEHSQDVKMVLWHPSMEILASASYDDTVKIWRDKDDDWYCSDTLKGHSSTVWAIDFDSTGNRLVSVSDDQSIKIWSNSNINDGFVAFKCVFTLEKAHSRAIYSVSWSKIHGLVATCGGDGFLRVFRLAVSTADTKSNQLNLVSEIPNAHGDLM